MDAMRVGIGIDDLMSLFYSVIAKHNIRNSAKKQKITQ